MLKEVVACAVSLAIGDFSGGFGMDRIRKGTTGRAKSGASDQDVTDRMSAGVQQIDGMA